MLEKLKGLTADRMDIADLIEVATLGTGALATCKAHELPVPGWLEEGVKVANAELAKRRHDMLVMRKRELEAQALALRTREQRVEQVNTELAAINAQLGT